MRSGTNDAPSAPEVWGLALAMASLPEAGPARRLALWRAGAPEEVWDAIRLGRAHRLDGLAAPMAPDPARLAVRWGQSASQCSPDDLLRAHLSRGRGITVLGSPSYPEVLAADREPPTVLCFEGDLDVLSGPRVAIVGTRRCTRYGRDLAVELGGELASAGVAVVSGLAAGIDAAAHRGALEVSGAAPVAVVGTGLDRCYPVSHTELAATVAERGVVLSEQLLGTPPRAWHFPSRNRIIAALADVVVVVESALTGGSMYTAREADDRGRQVLAVPGSVRSPASAGTNELLRACGVATGAADVLVALNLSPGGTRRAREARPEPSPTAARILDALGWQPAVLDQLVVRTALTVAEVAAGLEELEMHGWVSAAGPTWERRAGRS